MTQPLVRRNEWRSLARTELGYAPPTTLLDGMLQRAHQARKKQGVNP